MVKIGLTGGIGSGKSTIACIFNILGIPVYYADEEAKRIMNTDEGVKKSIIQHFGAAAYSEDKLDRKYLSSQVFTDSYKLDLLNSFVHPATIAAANQWMDKQTSSYSIKEAALLFEAGAAEHLDIIIGVFAPETLRIKRVMERDGVTRDAVLDRMRNQLDDKIKMKLCDHVIINDEKQLVTPQVLKLHELFLSMQ